MKKITTIIIVSLIASNSLFAQVGRGVYRFLELPVSSRIATLGGVNVSLRDNDANFSFNNPALLTTKTNKMLGLNFANYLASVKYGSAIYTHNINEKNFLSFGVQYIDYGNFEGYNEYREKTDDFTAKDMAMYLSYARPITENITVGVTLKPIVSVLERYTSVGIASDIGVNYKKELLSFGLVVRNLGVQLKGYYKDENNRQHREKLAFDVLLGVTKKFEHAPLRISATLNNLHRWDVSGYQSNLPKQVSIDGTQKEGKISFWDMGLRHLILGVEFVPSDRFYLGIGYNHRRQKEMKLGDTKSFAGFSFGAGVKLYKFQVGFGMTQYQVKNYAYQFSVSTNLGDFVGL